MSFSLFNGLVREARWAAKGHPNCAGMYLALYPNLENDEDRNGVYGGRYHYDYPASKTLEYIVRTISHRHTQRARQRARQQTYSQTPSSRPADTSSY